MHFCFDSILCISTLLYRCCPELYVDNWMLKKKDEIFTNLEDLVDEEIGESLLNDTESEKYLGDVISCDGRNTKNVKARRSKGVGIVEQILKILGGTIYGPYYFEVGLILRKSLFIKSVLTNSESWYGLKETEIEQLEQVDEMLLRKLLEVGLGCPKEMLFLVLATKIHNNVTQINVPPLHIK